MKKQIKECTVEELIKHFKLEGYKNKLTLTETGLSLSQGSVVIQFSINDKINIEEEKDAEIDAD